jgi:hypothetical protein
LWPDIFYPSLLICAPLLAVFLATVGVSYLWLRWVSNQATKCPECGKQGAGELIESKLLSSTTRTERRTRYGLFRQEERPTQVKDETYEDHFRCQSCKHEWIKTAQWTRTLPEKKDLPADTR